MIAGFTAIYIQAEKNAPNDADIFYLRGKAYAEMGHSQEAVTALQRAIELRPMDPAPYYQLGLTYRKLGQSERARQILLHRHPPLICSRPAWCQAHFSVSE